MAEEQAYTQAATTGKYDKASGLLGKYDNVRRFWEDQLTGLFLRPALNELVARKTAALERIRMGAGSHFDPRVVRAFLEMQAAIDDPASFRPSPPDLDQVAPSAGAT